MSTSNAVSPATPRARLMQLLARAFRVFVRSSTSPKIEPQNIRKIVWIRLDHIGDVVMSLPSLQLLREQFPNAQIDMVVRPACKALFDDLPLQDRVLVYDSPRFPSRGRGAGFFRTLQFIRKLRRQNYDIAIEPRGDDIARFLCWSSGAPIRLGPSHIFYEAADAPNFRFLMTHLAAVSDAPCHAVITNCALLAPLFDNRVLDVPAFHFPISDERRARIQTVLRQRGVAEPFAVLHPCSNDAARNWMHDGWAQIADDLIARGFDVVLSGIARDRATHQEIIALSKSSSHNHAARLHDFAGAIALPDLAAFFSLSQLLLTVDTGPMHIAAFADTPIVALFLPHLAPRHAPWNQQDSVVLPRETNNEYSIANIAVDEVRAAITRKLENR